MKQTQKGGESKLHPFTAPGANPLIPGLFVFSSTIASFAAFSILGEPEYDQMAARTMLMIGVLIALSSLVLVVKAVHISRKRADDTLEQHHAAYLAEWVDNKPHLWEILRQYSANATASGVRYRDVFELVRSLNQAHGEYLATRSFSQQHR